jgi:N-acetylglucosaminyldiphosphoundecaprenol N-acetyl-beta-D-mannosaminyltransferase
MSRPQTKLQATYENGSITAPRAAPQTNLTRNVYCILGVPIDATDLRTVVRRLEAAAADRTVLFLSTPNLNYLVLSLSCSEFRESLLDSDLCPPDGMPILWIARLLGLPIKKRAAGADLLDTLQDRSNGARQLTTYLFGGAKGVTAAAAEELNARSSRLTCVGAMDPGFADVSELSYDHVIEDLNRSRADFLITSLSAKKGQLWLWRNHRRLTIPIRSNLGSAINYQAGTLKRAPQLVRACGFEWLWRVTQERYLWKRYWNDGLVLLRLLFTRVLVLAIISRWQQFRSKHGLQDLQIKKTQTDQSIAISLNGAASKDHVLKASSYFQDALMCGKDIVLDLSETRQIDARFLGLLIMLRKELRDRGAELKFTAVPQTIARIFRLNELGFLLSPERPSGAGTCLNGCICRSGVTEFARQLPPAGDF